MLAKDFLSPKKIFRSLASLTNIGDCMEYLRVGVGTISTGCLRWRIIFRFLIASGKEKFVVSRKSLRSTVMQIKGDFWCFVASLLLLHRCWKSSLFLSLLPNKATNEIYFHCELEFISFDWEHGVMENILMFYVPYIYENVITRKTI